MVETARRPALSCAVMLTVFEIEVDQDASQLLDSGGEAGPDLFDRPKNGESVVARSWPSLKVWDPESPRASFFYLHHRFLVMDANAMRALRVALDRSGELIRLNVASVGDVFLFNPLLTLGEDAVDWPRTKGKLGAYHQVSLNKQLIPPSSIFRIQKIGGIFLSSELKEDESDFLCLHSKHRLTGITFKKLWDEQSGAVIY
jgi:hypothetical protein